MEAPLWVLGAKVAQDMLHDDPLRSCLATSYNLRYLGFQRLQAIEELPAPRVVVEVVQLLRGSSDRFRQLHPERGVDLARLLVEYVERLLRSREGTVLSPLHQADEGASKVLLPSRLFYLRFTGVEFSKTGVSFILRIQCNGRL